MFGGVVEARSWCPDVAIAPGRRPRASRLCALSVALGAHTTTSPFHQLIALEPAMQELIPHLDGSQDLDMLRAHLSGRMADPDLPLDIANALDASPAVLEDALAKLAESALLISES